MAKLQLAIEAAEDLGATDAQLRGARQLLQRRQKRSTAGSGGAGSGPRHGGSGRHSGRQSKSPGSSTHGGSAGPFGGSPRPGSALFRAAIGGTPRRANSPASPVAAEQLAAPLSGLHSAPDPEDASAWHTVDTHGKHGGLAALSSGLAPVKTPSPASLSADSTPSSSVYISSAAASTDGGDTAASPRTVARSGAAALTQDRSREQSPRAEGSVTPSSGRLPPGAESSPDSRPSPLIRSPSDRRRAAPEPPAHLQPVPAVASPATPPAHVAARSPAKPALSAQTASPRMERPCSTQASHSTAGSSVADTSPPRPAAPHPPQHTPLLRPSSASTPFERAGRPFDHMGGNGGHRFVSSRSEDGDEGLRVTDAVVAGPAYFRPRFTAVAAQPQAPTGHLQHERGAGVVRTSAVSSIGSASSASGWIAALSAFGADLPAGDARPLAPPSPAHGLPQEATLRQQPPSVDDRRSSWRRSMSLTAFRSSSSPPPMLHAQLPLPTPRSLSEFLGGSATEPQYVRPTSPASEAVSPSLASQLSPNAKEFRPEPRRPSRLSASHRCAHRQQAAPRVPSLDASSPWVASHTCQDIVSKVADRDIRPPPQRRKRHVSCLLTAL